MKHRIKMLTICSTVFGDQQKRFQQKKRENYDKIKFSYYSVTAFTVIVRLDKELYQNPFELNV